MTYFLYAVGEIFLVVVGILIAVQVSDWKEQSNLRQERFRLLSNLKSDFELRQNELVEFDEYFEKEIHVLNYLLPLFNQSDDLPSPNKIDSLLTFSLNSYSINESFKLLDLLFNSGRIDLIETPELKERLLMWPFLVEETLEEQRTLVEIYISLGLPEISRFIAYGDFGQYLSFRRYGRKVFDSKIKEDYTGLFQSQAFENYLALRLEFIQIMKSDRLKMIESNKRILELIELELKN
jgi:hypothetical protein